MIKIPTSFKDVMVKDYIALRPILTRKYDNPISRTIDLLGVFNKEEDVRKLKPIDLPNLDFLFKEPKRDVEQFFKINGKSYGIVNHVNDLEAGQYISVVSILKDLSKNPNLHIDKLHEILACVIFPVDEDKKILNIEPSYFTDLAEDIYNHMSIEEAYPMAVFFCNLSKFLTKTTQDYLSKKSEKMTEEARELILEVEKDLATVGGGLSRSITSAMEILQSDLTTKE